MSTSTDIARAFGQHFSIVLGRDLDTIRSAQRLRYEVYCREYGFEREEDCPGGLEQDDYDPLAYHCLIKHQATDTVAGCLRLIPHPPEPAQLLPIEQHCAAALIGATRRPSGLPQREVCEISRIAVSAQFRRRLTEHETPLGNPVSAENDDLAARIYPMLAVALFMAARVMMLGFQRPCVFAMMEPRLARMLLRVNMVFDRLGPVVDYHGQRAAYFLHYTPAVHAAAVADLRTELVDLLQVVQAQIGPQLAALADS